MAARTFPLQRAIRAYVVDGKSLRQIAEEVGWHHSRVHAYLVAAGVVMRPAGQGRPTAYDLPAADIARAYASGSTLTDLAAAHGCKTTSPIKRALAEAHRLPREPDSAGGDAKASVAPGCLPIPMAAVGGTR